MTRLNKVRKVLLYTLLLNVAVAAAKIIYGHAIGSISMLSDGIHSSADGTSNIIGLLGIWIASQPPDESHPYGHRKFETLATIGIAILIFGAGTEILRKSWDRLQHPSSIEVTYVSFAVMAITLMVNIGVMLYEAKKGRELKSDFLIADSMHTKTDIFISISVVISLVAARIGYPVIDVIAALVITAFIVRMGYTILKSAASVLTDESRLNPEEIKKVANTVQGVEECHEIRTRGNQDNICIDLHCLVDPEISIREGHHVAHAVEAEIRKKFPSVVDVVVHIEPYEK